MSERRSKDDVLYELEEVPLAETKDEERLARAISRVLVLLRSSLRPSEPAGRERNERLLTAKEVAELLAVSTETIYRDARTGKLEAVRLGRRVLFSRGALDRYRIMHGGSPHDP